MTCLRSAQLIGFVLMALGCARTRDRAPAASDTRSAAIDSTPASVADSVSTCAFAGAPFVISLEQMGPFKTGVSLLDLSRRCPLPQQDFHTYGGIQGPSYTFQFPGVRLVAVQFNCVIDEFCPTKPPTYWEASGDSVRLPDGGLVPKTVGEMRRRYGATLAIDGDFDDGGGNELYLCRFAHIFFALPGPVSRKLRTTPTLAERVGVPDSARVGEVRVWTPPQDTTEPFCPRERTP